MIWFRGRHRLATAATTRWRSITPQQSAICVWLPSVAATINYLFAIVDEISIAYFSYSLSRTNSSTAAKRSSSSDIAPPRSVYSSYSYPPSSYSSAGSSGGGRSSVSGSSSPRPRWSRAGSSVVYTAAEVQTLTPVREYVEKRAVEQPDLRDVFLCHAWDDRNEAAKELHNLLVAAGVKVWFSEKDLGLGVPMMRAIDKGLANSRIGLVLVPPALLARLPKESVADKELSVLLAGNTNQWPVLGLSGNALSAFAAKPFMPARILMMPAATQIRLPAGRPVMSAGTPALLYRRRHRVAVAPTFQTANFDQLPLLWVFDPCEFGRKELDESQCFRRPIEGLALDEILLAETDTAASFP